MANRTSRLPRITSSGRRPAPCGTSNTWKGFRTARWMSGHAATVMPRIRVRNRREGSSHSHSPMPATMAASTILSRRSSRSAPRSEVRHWSRAVSPSTPSSTDAAWTKIPPTTAREADSDHAAHIPTRAVNSDSAPGGIRAGEMAMVIRVEIGRFSHRDTGPSERLPSDWRSQVRASRRSSGVSMSCHHAPGGSGTARIGTLLPSRVTAPAREWSPPAEVCR